MNWGAMGSARLGRSPAVKLAFKCSLSLVEKCLSHVIRMVCSKKKINTTRLMSVFVYFIYSFTNLYGAFNLVEVQSVREFELNRICVVLCT